MYDDVAHDASNPYKGKLFNKYVAASDLVSIVNPVVGSVPRDICPVHVLPTTREYAICRPGGPDVYEGLIVDYSGDSVTAQNFLEVLAGRKDAPTILGGSGKTIQSGSSDRVWLYYADHGAPGILGMPTGGHKFLSVACFIPGAMTESSHAV